MRGYAVEQVFPAFAQDDLQKAIVLVEALPAKDKQGRWVRCHEVVRAVASKLDPRWVVVDGHYGSVEHSWLQIRNVILDLYAVASLPQVQLVDAMAYCRRNQYHEGSPRKDIRRRVIDWLVKLL